MILTVTLNPALDKTLLIDSLKVHDTNRIRSLEIDPGGKGINVSRLLKELGISTVASGFIGGDAGRYIESCLHRQAVRTEFVEIKGVTRTNIAVVEKEIEAPPTTFNETGPDISAVELEELERRLSTLMHEADMVAIGGSLPPGVPNETYARFIRLAADCRAMTVLDAEGTPFNLGVEAGPTMIKPNLREAERITGRRLKSESDILLAARELQRRGVKIVVISMGARGAIAVDDKAWKATPPRVESFSTIGSGDSMIAGILYGLMRGETFAEALSWGSAAGAATAATPGTAVGSLEDIRKLKPAVKVEQLLLENDCENR
ncbi:MAG: 1-phosphofructokinase [bacterium]|jgi:1-phosphofructokinase family hexose kinase